MAVLLHEPGDIIRHALIALGAGTLPSANGAWPIHFPSEPTGDTSPDECLTVKGTDGTDDGSDMISNELHEQYGFQVRFRAGDPTTCYAKGSAVAKLLDDLHRLSVPVTLNGTATYLIDAVTRGRVLSLGKETNGRRSLCTLNGTFSLYRTA